MLEYAGNVDVSAKPHQQSLQRAPTPGLRDWRTELSPTDVTAFEEVAGDLLRELGYGAATGSTAAGRARLAWYQAADQRVERFEPCFAALARLAAAAPAAFFLTRSLPW